MAVVSGSRTTLNPDAPLFIPASLQQVEDFSPEWWDLVKTSTWYREYWFQQHQELENFEGIDEDEDIASLLPDSIDLGMSEELFQETEFPDITALASEGRTPVSLKKGLEMNADALIKNLNLKSPKEGLRSPADRTRHWEKRAQCVSPKYTPRRIQQPR